MINKSTPNTTLYVHGVDRVDRAAKVRQVLEDGPAGLGWLVRGPDERNGAGIEEAVEVLRHGLKIAQTRRSCKISFGKDLGPGLEI